MVASRDWQFQSREELDRQIKLCVELDQLVSATGQVVAQSREAMARADQIFGNALIEGLALHA